MTDERTENRERFPEFSAIVDRYRGSIIAAWVYDPVTGKMLAGTAPTPEDHAPWPAEQLVPAEPPKKVVRPPYRGKAGR